MKKILLTMLALFLTLSLTACGSDSGKENEEKKGSESSQVEEKDGAEKTDDKIELYSDDTKMVFKNGNSQLVYYYSGDTITAYHAYIDYENATTAAYVATSVIEKNETIDKVYAKGRYVVVEYAKSTYEDTTATEVRQLYSAIEQYQNKK